MKSCGWVLWGLLVFGLRSAQAEQPLFVGIHGDPSRYVIEGMIALDREEMRERMAYNLLMIPSLRASISFPQALNRIKEFVQYRYQQEGYLEATVEVGWSEEAQTIAIRVQEGAKYRWKELRILGLEPGLEGELRHWLTKPQPESPPSLTPSVESKTTATLLTEPKAESPPGFLSEVEAETSVSLSSEIGLKSLKSDGEPLWTPGENAIWTEQTAQQMQEALAEELANLGYAEAKFQCRPEAAPADSTAALVIEVTRLGNPQLLDEVVIRGNVRQPLDEIKKLLGMQKGEICTRRRIEVAKDRLISSGCFQFVSIDLESRLLPIEPVTLAVDLWEYPESPILGQPLSEDQTLGMKVTQWLSGFPTADHDLVLELQAGGDWATVLGFHSATLALGAKRTAVLVADITIPHWDRQRVAAGLKDEDLHIVELASGCRLTLPERPELQRSIFLKLQGGRFPANSNKTHNILFNAGVKARKHLESGVCFLAEPMPIISALAGEWKLAADQQSAEFRTYQFEGGTARFEAATGRPVDVSVEFEELKGRVRTEAGAVQRLWREHIDSARVSFHAGSQPALKIVQFVNAIAEDTAQRTKSAEAQRVGLACRMVTNAISHDSAEAVSDPESEQLGGDPEDFAQRNRIDLEVFAPGSTAWDVTREILVTYVTGDPDWLAAILAKPDAGPLLHLEAMLCTIFQSQISTDCARHGLQRLEVAHLQSDVNSLLDPRSQLREPLLAAVRGVRKLSGEELSILLGGPVSPEDRAAALALSDDDLARWAIERVWVTDGQRWFRQLFERIGGPEEQVKGILSSEEPIEFLKPLMESEKKSDTEDSEKDKEKEPSLMQRLQQPWQ